MEAVDKATIIVDGGYKPGMIKIKKGKPVTLTFIRKDSNPCLEEIIVPDYKIKKYLPLNTPVSVTFSPNQIGKTEFHCGMNMYKGKIEVV